jgi:hypothetical protein
MKLFRSEKKNPPMDRTESLSCIPCHLPELSWKRLANGEVRIEYPLNINPFFLQIARRFQKEKTVQPTKKLQLDELGSALWCMIDGKKSVKSLIVEFAKIKKFSIQEAEQSVTTFLRELGKRGIILLSNGPET